MSIHSFKTNDVTTKMTFNGGDPSKSTSLTEILKYFLSASDSILFNKNFKIESNLELYYAADSSH